MRLVLWIGFMFGLWVSVAWAQHHSRMQGNSDRSDWVHGPQGLQGRDWAQPEIWPRPSPYEWERCWRQNFFGGWERVC